MILKKNKIVVYEIERMKVEPFTTVVFSSSVIERNSITLIKLQKQTVVEKTAIARNPNTPAAVLAELSKDEDWVVRFVSKYAK